MNKSNPAVLMMSQTVQANTDGPAAAQRKGGPGPTGRYGRGQSVGSRRSLPVMQAALQAAAAGRGRWAAAALRQLLHAAAAAAIAAPRAARVCWARPGCRSNGGGWGEGLWATLDTNTI